MDYTVDPNAVYESVMIAWIYGVYIGLAMRVFLMVLNSNGD